MTMKHNKKRNTAFIYETLVREMTKSIVGKDAERKQKVLIVIKEHYNKSSVLFEELEMYKMLLETKNVHKEVAERILQETKKNYSKLDGDSVFEAQSKLIAAINKSLGKGVWSSFIPNFKSFASVNAIFNNKSPVKSRVLFEQSVVDAMSNKLSLSESNKLNSVDDLTYHSFIKKYNEKYGDLLKEQKELLNRYITSFADDGFELRIYLNEELTRLKEEVEKAKVNFSEGELIFSKLDEVSEYLGEFQKREFTDTDLKKVLRTQQLIQELVSDD